MRLSRLLFALPLCLAALCPAAEEDGEAAVADLRKDLTLNDLKDSYRLYQAIYAAGCRGAASASLLPDLTALLEDNRSTVVREAAWAVGRIGPAAQSATDPLAKAYLTFAERNRKGDRDRDGVLPEALLALERIDALPLLLSAAEGRTALSISKRDAAYLLAEFGQPEVLQPLLDLLPSEDANIRAEALEALGLLASRNAPPDARIAAALKAALDDGDAGVLRAAAQGLALLPGEQRAPAHEKLFALVESDADESVREAAARALMQDEKWAVRLVAILAKWLGDQGLRSNADELLTEIKHPGAIEALRDAYPTLTDSGRDSLSITLQSLRRHALDILIPNFQDADVVVRIQASRQLVRYARPQDCEPEDVAALEEFLADEDLEVMRNTAEFIAKAAEYLPQALAVTANCLAHEDPTIRRTALEALRHYRRLPPSAQQALLKIANAGEAQDRLTACYLLSLLGVQSETVRNVAFATLMGDAPPQTQYYASEILASAGVTDLEMGNALLKRMGKTDPWPRKGILQGFAPLAERMPGLVRTVLENRNCVDFSRPEGSALLQKIFQAHGNLVLQMVRDPAETLRWDALQMMARFRAHEAAPVLKELLGSTDERVRKEAANALSYLPVPDPELVALALNDPSPSVRMAVGRSALQLEAGNLQTASLVLKGLASVRFIFEDEGEILHKHLMPHLPELSAQMAAILSGDDPRAAGHVAKVLYFADVLPGEILSALKKAAANADPAASVSATRTLAKHAGVSPEVLAGLKKGLAYESNYGCSPIHEEAAAAARDLGPAALPLVAGLKRVSELEGDELYGVSESFQALARIGARDPDVASFFGWTLRHGGSYQRVLATDALALWEQPGDGMIRLAYEALRTDPDRRARGAAAALLGAWKIDRPEVRSAFFEILREEDWDNWLASGVLEGIASFGPASPAAPTAIALIREKGPRAKEGAALACAEAVALLDPASRESAELLIEYLRRPNILGSPDYESRAAIPLLAKLKVDRLWLSGRLACLIDDPRPIRRRRAAEAAGLLGVATPETLKALANLLDDDEKAWIAFPEDGRNNSTWTTHSEIAAWALGRMGKTAKAALPKLRERKEKAAPSLRSRIEAAIAAIEKE